jgi:hypothetical protein
MKEGVVRVLVGRGGGASRRPMVGGRIVIGWKVGAPQISGGLGLDYRIRQTELLPLLLEK